MGLVAAVALLVGRSLPDRDPGLQVAAQLVAPTVDASGYARVTGPQPLAFPADHGPHPDYQTEWWYYTGNLQTADGRRFGYQLTFFRRALAPPAERAERESDWAADQAYMAHLALTDVAGREHRAFQRYARGAAGLAGAAGDPFRVWLEDWKVEAVAPNGYQLRAAQENLALDLLLVDEKGPILHGDAGYSQKGPDPGNASIYFSQTRLASSGTVALGNAVFEVEGTSWMDHEFSTSALAANQIGWDWFALQLDDGSELMVFQIRQVDGRIDPFSSGTLIAPDGSTRHLTHGEYTINPVDTWRSPHSGAAYPARWKITVPSTGLYLEITPFLADQEMNVSTTYWEGAVHITGEQDGTPVTGVGYVEMTGYAGSMQGQF
jgi:predicted secreted hydrolase